MGDQIKAKEKSKRITAHNKLIREGRKIGILKPLATETYHLKMQRLINNKQDNRKRLTSNGSVLPNKMALWSDDDYCDQCY